MCNRDSCRWPYISLVERVIVLQSSTNSRMNGSCACSIATSFSDSELGRPTWKQNHLITWSAALVKAGPGVITFHRCKATKTSLVAPRCFLVFSRRREGRFCVSLTKALSARQSLGVRMRSWVGLVHSGSYRIEQAESVFMWQNIRGKTYHEKRNLHKLEIHHIIKHSHGSLDPFKKHVTPCKMIGPDCGTRHGK